MDSLFNEGESTEENFKLYSPNKPRVLFDDYINFRYLPREYNNMIKGIIWMIAGINKAYNKNQAKALEMMEDHFVDIFQFDSLYKKHLEIKDFYLNSKYNEKLDYLMRVIYGHAHIFKGIYSPTKFSRIVNYQAMYNVKDLINIKMERKFRFDIIFYRYKEFYQCTKDGIYFDVFYYHAPTKTWAIIDKIYRHNNKLYIYKLIKRKEGQEIFKIRTSTKKLLYPFRNYNSDPFSLESLKMGLIVNDIQENNPDLEIKSFINHYHYIKDAVKKYEYSIQTDCLPVVKKIKKINQYEIFSIY